jgi:hypothetical protein
MRAVTVGSIASAIGVICDVWFLIVYSGSDGAKFQVRFTQIRLLTSSTRCSRAILSTAARPGRLQHLLLLLSHLSHAHVLFVRLYRCAYALPPRRRLECMVHSGPRHVLRRWCAPYITVPHLRLPPRRKLVHLDHMAGCTGRACGVVPHSATVKRGRRSQLYFCASCGKRTECIGRCPAYTCLLSPCQNYHSNFVCKQSLIPACCIDTIGILCSVLYHRIRKSR